MTTSFHRWVHQREISLRGVRVRFEGGVADGKLWWHRDDGDLIRACNFPPLRIGVDMPLDTIRRDRRPPERDLYRVDREPQPDGIYIARLLPREPDQPPKTKLQPCHRCGDKPTASVKAACYIPGCPHQ